MAKKTLADVSTEKLKAQKKTITAIIFTLSGIMLIYIGVVIYLMASGKWDKSSALGVVPLAGCTAVIGGITAILGSINNEIKKREQAS